LQLPKEAPFAICNWQYLATMKSKKSMLDLVRSKLMLPAATQSFSTSASASAPASVVVASSLIVIPDDENNGNESEILTYLQLRRKVQNDKLKE